MAACKTSSNPLLDTISVLTYDDPCDDSDDYYDLNSAYEERSKSSNKNDGESIGYAGSSSIDSGYKSFCPTPEMPDPSVYSRDAASLPQQSDNYSVYSSGENSKSGKPKIMMGTKVISRQQQSGCLSRDSTATSKRTDASLYEVNLDQLMYLRQSLLSAIQKCENSSEQDTSPTRRDSSEVCNSSTVTDEPESNCKSSSSNYQKTVRFNTDVKVTTVGARHKKSSASDGDSPPKKKTSNHSRSHSKSILKDPLCENLRSKLKQSSDCSLEEEIDSLLYGRAEFYDLESVEDFPCSYVTMIEEKYRGGKTSVAKVRKLKSGKNSEKESSDPKASNATTNSSTSNATSETEERGRAEQETDATKRSISSSAKCRFTEVAKCMIEIIEDLQMKKLQSESTKDRRKNSENIYESKQEATKQRTQIESECKDSIHSCSRVADCYGSASDYHVYEEIAYDCVDHKKYVIVEVPPPLPARPSVLEMTSRPKLTRRPMVSQMPRRGRLSRRSSEEGSLRNRPKQRSNLYSLFSDKNERRNISRSLEREWRGREESVEDEYGFRKVFTSI